MSTFLTAQESTFIENLATEQKINEAQQKKKSTNYKHIENPKNIIFLEFGGTGFAYTINYYRMLIKPLSLRLGFVVTFDAFDYYLPIVLNYVYAINHNHRLEIGLGVSMAFSRNPSKKTVDAFGVFVFGYRFFPFSDGLSVNISFTPFFGNSPYTGSSDIFKYFLPWAGLGVGYAF